MLCAPNSAMLPLTWTDKTPAKRIENRPKQSQNRRSIRLLAQPAFEEKRDDFARGSFSCESTYLKNIGDSQENEPRAKALVCLEMRLRKKSICFYVFSRCLVSSIKSCIRS